jgi:AraC-like DNA-binding protein
MAQTSMEPALAGSVGGYAEAPPSRPLRAHLRCIWFHRIPENSHAPIRVVPDGCVDLRWIEGRLTVAGPDRSAMLETIPPGAFVIGFRFLPARASRWLGLPMSEIVDRRVPLEDLWGAEARRLADGAGEAGAPSQIVRRLELGLGRKAEIFEAADQDMECVFALLSREGFSTPSVADLVGQLGLSERTLRRRCREAFGYGPKTLERILRFQRFLRLVRSPGGDGMARLAAEAGYADQAHLAREVKRLSGLSPSEVARHLV